MSRFDKELVEKGIIERYGRIYFSGGLKVGLMLRGRKPFKNDRKNSLYRPWFAFQHQENLREFEERNKVFVCLDSDEDSILLKPSWTDKGQRKPKRETCLRMKSKGKDAPHGFPNESPRKRNVLGSPKSKSVSKKREGK